MPVCRRCQEEKPLEGFHRDRATTRGHKLDCKACVAATRPSRKGSAVSQAYWASFYAANKETLLDKARTNEDRKAYSRQRYANDRARIRAQQRAYASTAEAKALHAATQRKRNKRLAEATPPWLTDEQRTQIDYTYWHAKDATAVTGEPYHVDHILPLRGKSVCGLHVPWNLRVVPAEINLRKHTSIEGQNHG